MMRVLGIGADEGENPISPSHPEILRSYRVAEFTTLTRDGSPVCWPMFPDVEGGRLIFNTGYAYPTKARNAQRNPRVAALFSDPTASGRTDEDPYVLVQGLADVFDQDLQRNTDRYVDQLMRKGPMMFRVVLRIPWLRQLLVGYLARIWIEVIPHQEHVWARTSPPPPALCTASRPDPFSPGPGIELSASVVEWLQRYTRPPVLSFVDSEGWPVIIRTQATVKRDHIGVETNLEASSGAPVCLTYHRLIGDHRANDAFIIRGHFDEMGRLIPEKVVGYAGSRDDRGVGSLKLMRMLWAYRGKLIRQLEREGKPVPVVRPPAKV